MKVVEIKMLRSRQGSTGMFLKNNTYSLPWNVAKTLVSHGDAILTSPEISVIKPKPEKINMVAPEPEPDPEPEKVDLEVPEDPGTPEDKPKGKTKGSKRDTK